ncbi:condensation domain-containing protein [Nonomuraea sp. NPDC049695]|uniref:condensation domain-containing protein n=1 Tax=Nonomuraea sp. NPDC049695 TaxID=3154734 RepID=UPI00341C0367
MSYEPPVPPETRLPNSHAQRSLLCSRRPPRPCVTAAIELSGPVREDMLRARLAEVVRCRPALRSRFTSEEEHSIAAVAEAGFACHLVEGSEPESWSRAYEMAAEDATRRFPAGQSPLVRLAVFTTRHGRHLLVVDADPLVCDAWSANLLVDDLLGEERRGEPDDYVEVWRARQAWVDGPGHAEALDRRLRSVKGAWRQWPVSVGTSGPCPDPRADLPGGHIDIDVETATALRERVRKARGSMLAVAAAALRMAFAGALPAPLALTTTFAARETQAEAAVVGLLATEGVLALPPLSGTVNDYLRVLRDEIFAALADQRLPYESVAPHLGGPAAGLSMALLYLPEQLTGGKQRDLLVGTARAARTGLMICPSGADVDLFMLEQPPPVEDGLRPALRLGAQSGSSAVDDATVNHILHGWARMVHVLAGQNWSARQAASLSPAGHARIAH